MQLTIYWILFIFLCGIQMPLKIKARSLPDLKSNETQVANAPPIIEPLHIRRMPQKIPDMPMDLLTMHSPCDMDSRGRQSYVFAFPNHCIWAFNNRYLSEGHFRIFKTYQVEGFFFGQYYERLKRYEFDPHTYDYNL
ncbi:LOW QUALITY PROTEIN: uncharacterized protein LOC128255479 [Drosophila gunungcola]|uniref:LOW QUALITY PROTEIN: uncharacterized protein LOC128255479 n=1 Tax=Drosophila gunungcola TaxID=103775 RepID=UPI0022E68F1B|nr:LOW QUALITY PROTEIN: uncharacterized protein LOC128255479 [Drosophila gunungcola]